jgi:hypothetical protein
VAVNENWALVFKVSVDGLTDTEVMLGVEGLLVVTDVVVKV